MALSLSALRRDFLQRNPLRPANRQAEVESLDAARLSFIEVFYEREKAHPERVFLRQPYGASYRELSYREAGQEARRMAAALIALGHQPGDRVGIYSKNCYHWILAD